MIIQVIDPNVCEKCTLHRCSYVNVANIKNDFYNLPTETTICPTSAIGDNGPIDIIGDDRFINSDKCVSCGLCICFCSEQNLRCEEYDSDTALLGNLTERQLKAVTSSYLNQIFEFAANTNRNGALLFDGYVSTKGGEEAFVEIDYHDDSLESTRRLLGDILMFSQNHRIYNGILVLSSLPSSGSRDVYTVIEKVRRFPTTTNIHVYMTTFSILRKMSLFMTGGDYCFKDLFFDCMEETVDEYYDRIEELFDY